MRRGNGNQKIPENMEDLFDASMSIKSDDVSSSTKRTFSQMMVSNLINWIFDREWTLNARI